MIKSASQYIKSNKNLQSVIIINSQSSFYTLKAILKRYVFKQDLKVNREVVLRRLAGSAFQRVGAATLNALSPNDLSIFPIVWEIIMPELERNE